MAEWFDDLAVEPDPAFSARLAAQLQARLDGAVPTLRDVPAGDGASAFIDIADTTEGAAMNSTNPRRTRMWAALGAAAACLVAVIALAASRGGDDDPSVGTDDPATTAAETPSTTLATDPPSTTAPATTAPATTEPATTAPATTVASEPPPVEPMDAAGAQQVATLAAPAEVATDGTTVWVLQLGGPIVRLDAATGAELGRIDIVTGDERVIPPVIGFGSLWVATAQDDMVWRVDLATGEIQSSFPAPGDVFPEDSLAIGADAIYLLSHAGGPSIARIDPADNRVTATIPTTSTTFHIHYGFDSLWAGSLGGLIRLDPTTGEQLGRVNKAYQDPVGFGFGSVWLTAGETKREMFRVDPETVEIESSFAWPLAPSTYAASVAFTDDAVWMTSGAALLTRIDPDTGALVARYGPTEAGGSLAAAPDGTLWVTDVASGAVYRVPAVG